MGVFEIKGGPITHKYLMQKTKSDMAYELLREIETSQKVRKILSRAKTAVTYQAVKWAEAMKQKDDNEEYFRGLADGYGGAWNLINAEQSLKGKGE